LSLAFPRFDLGVLAWMALAPFLSVARGRSAGEGLRLGLLLGIGFFGPLLSWISMVGWVAWALLVLLQSLFLGLFGMAWAVGSRRVHGFLAVFLAPVLWVAVEYLRSVAPLGGFTWGQLAQAQHDFGWLLRLASLGGGWTVAFLLVLVNALLAEAWARRGRAWREALPTLAAAAILIAAPLLLPAPNRAAGPARVAIVQGNVPRNFDGSWDAKNRVILSSHLRLTRRLAARPDPPDIVVWPESSIGMDFRTAGVKEAVSEAARAVGATLVVGGDLDLPNGGYKVMTWQIDPRGRVVDSYQKTHLVPYGEYAPGRAFLDWVPMLDQIPHDAVAGTEETVFSTPRGRLAPVLSYDGDFGSLVRARIDAGGRLLVVGTNTSTWGDSAASAQHLAAVQVRAAENAVWAVHASVSGISAFVDPQGAVVASTPLWTATTLTHDVRFAAGETFYTRTGDWLPVSCLAASLAALVAAGARELRRGDSTERTTSATTKERRGAPVA
jgi:apolipoprotein N-acyltransferase